MGAPEVKPHQHPSDKELQTFVRGTSSALSPHRNAELVLHFLRGCSLCQQRAQTLLRQPPGGDYRRAFEMAERALATFFSVESTAPALVELLFERSNAIRYRDSREMLRFAQLAKQLAEACSSQQAGSEARLCDLRGRAQGNLANALRVCGQLSEAEEAIQIAQRSMNAGTGDPPLRARLLEQTSSLRMVQGRFSEAIELAQEAAAIYEEIGQTQSLASALVHTAVAFYYASEPDEAIPLINRAIPLIDPEHDPHLLLAASHNLILSYLAAGRPEQALSLYFEARDLYREFDDELILLRVGWQEGQLLRDLGHLQAAETALLQARKGFVERNLAHEAAFVSLDLAWVYVKLGKVDEVKRTVKEAVPIFRSLRVGREALAALLQLRHAAGQERRAIELIRSLNGRLSSNSPR